MAYCKLRVLGSFLVITLLASCKSEPSKETKSDAVQLMADLHCEAVSFRKARFELADKMRFMEDTLIQPTTADSVKVRLKQELDALTPYKDSVVTGGLELAKVIKSKLDSLIEQEFTEQSQRELFDAELTAELERRGCQ